jgi:hypothetical protein
MRTADIQVRITKKAADPICTRVSVGGNPADGIYCVYRGTKEEALVCLTAALEALKAMAELIGPNREPDIAPDDGKKYA